MKKRGNHMRAFVLLLFVGCCNAAVSVSMDAATDGVPSVLLTFSSRCPVFVLNWDSPLHSAFHGRWLKVVDVASGAELPYVGPTARFTAQPSVASYVPLPEQTQVSFKRDFALVRGMKYRLSFVGIFADHLLEMPSTPNRTSDLFVPLPVQVVSAPVVWHYASRDSLDAGKENESVALSAAPTGLRFKQCSAQQTTASKEGWAEAHKQISAGKKLLGESGPSGCLYKTWFGSSSKYDSGVSKVLLTTHTWVTQYDNATVDCRGAECEDDVYAYVFPADKSETIYLCGAYWNSVLLEQGNTFVHEIAHFRYVGNTDDLAYGKAACKKLAKNDPAEATENSDNFSYFCEEAASARK